MFTNYDDKMKTIQVREALNNLGINFEKDEVKYFSDIIVELCLCMSLSNNDIKCFITNRGNLKTLARMKAVGNYLNQDNVDGQEKKIVNDYIASYRLELANFAYEVGLSNFNRNVDSCARKINDKQDVNDTLIQFARIMYEPVILKSNKKDKSNKVKSLSVKA